MCKTLYKLLAAIFYVAGIGGCEEALESSLTELKVELTAPGENVTTSSPVNFNWESLPGATSYRIRIMSPAFGASQVLITDSVISSNIISLALANGMYQWKVQALNSSTASQESDARNLTID